MPHRTPQKPNARSSDLIIEHLDGEVLVFDLKTATATCLNGWTSRLWQMADGTRDLADLATEMAATEDMVAEGLAQLAGQGLLEGEDQAATFRRATAPELTRRQVMGRIGGAAKLATIAAPGVVAITVPRAVRAASGCVGGPGTTGGAVPATACSGSLIGVGLSGASSFVLYDDPQCCAATSAGTIDGVAYGVGQSPCQFFSGSGTSICLST